MYFQNVASKVRTARNIFENAQLWKYLADFGKILLKNPRCCVPEAFERQVSKVALVRFFSVVLVSH